MASPAARSSLPLAGRRRPGDRWRAHLRRPPLPRPHARATSSSTIPNRSSRWSAMSCSRARSAAGTFPHGDQQQLIASITQRLGRWATRPPSSRPRADVDLRPRTRNQSLRWRCGARGCLTCNSGPFAIGAAVRDDPAAAAGYPAEMRRRSSQFLLLSIALKVPQWLSPREKPRRRSGTCAAAIMR